MDVTASCSGTVPAIGGGVSYFTGSNTEAKSKDTHLGLTAHKWLILGAQGLLRRERRSPHQDLRLVAAVYGLPWAREWSHWLLHSLILPQKPFPASSLSGFALTCLVLLLAEGMRPDELDSEQNQPNL